MPVRKRPHCTANTLVSEDIMREISARIHTIEPRTCTPTPLERQYITLKQQNKDTILLVECGYKMILYGRDAEIASKHLRIMCILKEGAIFHTASVPVLRTYHHVAKLVYLGFKVGIVRQTETAHGRAEEGGKGLFERSLCEVYTMGTWILCPEFFTETKAHSETLHRIVIVSEFSRIIVWTSLWENREPLMEWCHFSDDIELESLLCKLEASDLLLSHDTSNARLNWYQTFLSINRGINCDDASGHVYLGWFQDITIDDRLLASDGTMGCPLDIMNAPSIGVYLNKLNEYLEPLTKQTALVKNIRKAIPTGSFVNLSIDTVRQLEIFQSTECDTKLSLWNYLHHTATAFGTRQLRKWILNPTRDPTTLNQRYGTVEFFLTNKEICEAATQCFLDPLRVQDLEAQLQRIASARCSITHLFSFLRSMMQFQKLPQLLESVSNRLCFELEDVSAGLVVAEVILNEHSVQDWKEGKPSVLFQDVPNEEAKKVQDLERYLLNDHATDICAVLGQPRSRFSYRTVADVTWLIEVPHEMESQIPVDWILESRTKSLTRYHTKTIKSYMNKIAWAKEKAEVFYRTKWVEKLELISQSYYSTLQKTIRALGILDSIFSLVCVSSRGGKYVRPQISQTTGIEVKNGRHPVVEQLRGEAYVSNSVSLSKGGCCMMLTGPNTGGKSVYLKMVGVLSLLAQIGSFVPAECMTFSPFDGIYTRMGSKDDVSKIRGRSTFMYEMTETSAIMRSSTSQSLVLLDEIGRGTSTFDGTAVAYACLSFFLKKGCVTIFVTHFTYLQELCPPCSLSCMGYAEAKVCQEKRVLKNVPVGMKKDIVMQYQIRPGRAESSFGLSVAQLAGLPQQVLHSAEYASRSFQYASELRNILSN